MVCQNSTVCHNGGLEVWNTYQQPPAGLDWLPRDKVSWDKGGLVAAMFEAWF
jgi:hypothetical protein